MASILEGGLAGEVTAALEAEGVPYALTITRTETTGGNPFDPASGTTEDVAYPCRGWRDAYRQDERDGTLILQSDVRVMVIVSSLTIEPDSSDTITVDGEQYNVVSVRRDPAGALWDIQGRK